jgi:MoxR-like ATPase
MSEQQVTIEGVTRELPAPFVVLATQNPIEFEGTYPLPEAQLDRFLIRVSVGYPSSVDEAEMLERRLARSNPVVELHAVADRVTFLAMQEAVERVHAAPDLVRYIVSLVAATREHSGVQVGASPRGSLALLAASRARAAVRGRDFVRRAVPRPSVGPSRRAVGTRHERFGHRRRVPDICSDAAHRGRADRH